MIDRPLRPAALLLASLTGVPLASCGPPAPFVATFTSEVVQRESCRRLGDATRESCTRDELVQELRVSLIEDEGERALLAGVPREGDSDRALVGTRDSAGGWLFIDERVQRNEASGCTLTERIQLSLRVSPDAPEDDIGLDECIALVGREERTFATSAACDNVGDPPQAAVRILRRRWQDSSRCGADP